MDLKELKPQELKNLLANNAKHNQMDTVVAVLREMQRRGIATKKEYRYLTWNQEAAREALAPFKEVAHSIQTNQRTAYTEAGGFKIGRAKGDPEWCWVDSYSAIKTPSVNAVFVCYIRQPGDEAEFQLQVDGSVARTFNADALADALEEWRAVAMRAVRQEW